MTLKRHLVRALDSSAGRSLLAWLTTRRARRLLGRPDVEVSYSGLWAHRVGEYTIPDGPRFEYHDARLRSWADEVPKHRRNAEDYWFRHYAPEPGDVIIDVGAGRGEDVLAFAERVGPTGRVIAIEAHPASFRLLEAFCRLNDLRNVTPLHYALMDRSGSVTIQDADDWKESTVTTTGVSSGTVVPATTLDAICSEQQLDQIAFLKMNIEGAERLALRGMGATLPRIRQICVCCHDFRANKGDGELYRTRGIVEECLTRHGFTVSARLDDRRAYVRDHLHGTRNSAV